MFKAIKQYAFRRDVGKKLHGRKHVPVFFNFNAARTVEILYAYSEPDRQAVEKIIAFLAARSVSCSASAYCADKKQKATLELSVTHLFFDRTEVNWYGKCRSGKVLERMEQPVDIFIDLSRGDIPGLRYCAMLSNARMKVGRSAYPGHPYDLVISPGDIDVSPEALADALIHYLQTIEMKQ